MWSKSTLYFSYTIYSLLYLPIILYYYIFFYFIYYNHVIRLHLNT